MKSEYLEFNESESASGKTKVVQVISRNHGDVLGEIKWFGRWRRYAFWPNPGTIWDVACLTEINAYITNLMATRAKK